jgi:hypothetical protein
VAPERARWRRRPGRPQRLRRLDHLGRELEPEAAVLISDRPDLAAELHGEVMGLRVALEIGDHLVAAGIAVRVAGELEPGKAVVAPRREERERVPARAPRSTDRVGGVEDYEAAVLLGELVAHGQAGLAGADHCYVVMVWSMHVLKVLGVVDCLPRQERLRIPTGRDASRTPPVRGRSPQYHPFWRAFLARYEPGVSLRMGPRGGTSSPASTADSGARDRPRRGSRR